MREQVKQQIRDMIATLGRAEGILDSSSKKKDEDAVNQLLEDMQNSAMAIGTAIEEEEGLETETVEHLEEYCELLYQYLSADELKERFRIGRELAGERGEIVSCLEREVEGRIEVVFLLCRADRWKDMERLYEVAKEKPGYDCSVLVSPYRERLKDAAALEGMTPVHDETGQFPASAQAMDYGTYDMEEQTPDMVFLTGPYAADGNAGIVPEYDFAEIRECAGIVVYMPSYEDESQADKADCLLPQVKEADMVIVPSEKIRSIYIDGLRGMEDGAEMAKRIKVAGTVNAVRTALHKFL